MIDRQVLRGEDQEKRAEKCENRACRQGKHSGGARTAPECRAFRGRLRTQRNPSFRPRRLRTDPLASKVGGGGVNELTSAGGIGKSCGFVSYIFRQAAQCAAARYVGIWLFMVCTWPSRDPAVPFNMPASAIIW